MKRFFFGFILLAALVCFGKDSVVVKPPIKPPAPVVAAHTMVNDTTVDQFAIPQGVLIVTHDSIAHVTYIDTINNIRIDDYFKKKNEDGKYFSTFRAVKQFVKWEPVK